jgi:hypothetical protein
MLYNPINIQYNMPITIGFFLHGNGLIIFPLFLMGKIRLVYVLLGIKSKDLEGIKDVYRGTTVSDGS